MKIELSRFLATVIVSTVVVAGCSGNRSESVKPVTAPVTAEGEGLRPFDAPDFAYRYYVDQRKAAGEETIDYSRYERALEEAKKLPVYSSSSDRFFAPGERVAIRGWTDRGPSNVAGRTRALAFRPGSPNTIYAAGVAGGLWRSTDRGVTWSAYGDLLSNMAIVTIAIHPTTPDVMYVGTGEGVFEFLDTHLVPAGTAHVCRVSGCPEFVLRGIGSGLLKDAMRRTI